MVIMSKNNNDDEWSYSEEEEEDKRVKLSSTSSSLKRHSSAFKAFKSLLLKLNLSGNNSESSTTSSATINGNNVNKQQPMQAMTMRPRPLSEATANRNNTNNIRQHQPIKQMHMVSPRPVIKQQQQNRENNVGGSNLASSVSSSFENQISSELDKFTFVDSAAVMPKYNTMSSSLYGKADNNSYMCKAIAIHSFRAQSENELDFKKGDLIYVRKKLNENWYLGEHNGYAGAFPHNFVYFFKDDSSLNTLDVQLLRKQLLSLEGVAKVKYDFFPQVPIELELHRGELVSLIGRVDANWYEGYIGHRQGIFPVQYVETIKEPINTDENDLNELLSGYRGHDTLNSKQQRQPQQQPQQQQFNNKNNHLYQQQSSSQYSNSRASNNNQQRDVSYIFESLAPAQQQQLVHTLEILRKTNPRLADYVLSNKPELYVVRFEYKPQQEDEIELMRDDLILVYKKCDDGWMIGLKLSAMDNRLCKFGTFPGNFVQPYNASPTSSSSSPLQASFNSSSSSTSAAGVNNIGNMNMHMMMMNNGGGYAITNRRKF